MQNTFDKYLRETFPDLLKSKILVAVSGGVDSVVLAHLCHRSQLNFSIAHCNFNLRAEESDRDEDFVAQLAEAFDVEVFIESFETEAYARESNISIQMAARDLRYHWFEELRETLNFNYIFTAHHANDNLETVLINFVRGTGLDGLTGIPQINDHIVRPLLAFTREEIEDFAKNNNLQWQEDSTNASAKYFRNKLRLEVIPLLLEMNPQLMSSFDKTLNHLQQSALLIEDYMSVLFPKLAQVEDFGYSFKISLLKSVPNIQAVLYGLFKNFNFTQWDDIYALLEAQPGKVVYSATHRLIKDREKLLLTLNKEESDEQYEIGAGEEVVMLPMGTFHFEEVPGRTPSDTQSIFVDAARLKFPLLVRKWEKGDYFSPFGMEGRKKLSKFFKDEKFSLPQKESCWVLCADGEIIWVIGYRLDARFALDTHSKNILRISYTP